MPLKLTILPPPLIQHAAGGLDPEQVKTLFPAVSVRLVELGNLAVAAWRERITKIPGRTGRPLKLGPYVPLDKTTYAASVQLAPAEWEASALSVTVYADSPQAEPIEDGTPGGDMDLHKVLLSAPKARISKAGNLYLRIPFRHATVSAEGGPVLPKTVVAAMKSKATYLTVGRYFERGPNVQHGMVTRFLYSKNPGRLTAAEMDAINRRAAAKKGYLIPPGQAKRLEGLMRTGAKGHGGYLTIRTLSQAKTGGWRVPAYPAQKLVEQVRQEITQAATDWFDDAIRADIERWIAAAGA